MIMLPRARLSMSGHNRMHVMCTSGSTSGRWAYIHTRARARARTQTQKNMHAPEVRPRVGGLDERLHAFEGRWFPLSAGQVLDDLLVVGGAARHVDVALNGCAGVRV